MTITRQPAPTTNTSHFATLLLMAIAPQDVGARIATRRKELGWTHERLAREMNVGLRTVQRWQEGRDKKTGKSWLPRLSRLMDLADVMGVERSYFVEEERKPQDPLAVRLEALEATVKLGFQVLGDAIEQLAARLPLEESRRR